MDIDFALQSLSWPDAILRVVLALAFGFCLGYDRDKKNKPVDFRVYMIVAGTTCLLAIMGEELLATHNTTDSAQIGLLRIVQGVLTGIGFLGAGAIMKSSDNEKVIGTATGASIWAAGSFGLMLGFGLYGLASLGFVVLIVILMVFGVLREPLFNEKDKNERS